MSGSASLFSCFGRFLELGAGMASCGSAARLTFGNDGCHEEQRYRGGNDAVFWHHKWRARSCERQRVADIFVAPCYPLFCERFALYGPFRNLTGSKKWSPHQLFTPFTIPYYWRFRLRSIPLCWLVVNAIGKKVASTRKTVARTIFIVSVSENFNDALEM